MKLFRTDRRKGVLKRRKGLSNFPRYIIRATRDRKTGRGPGLRVI